MSKEAVVVPENQNQQRFSAWDKFKNAFFAEHTSSGRRKVFNTLWAVLVGFIISGILIAFTGHNPFAVFFALFNDGLTIFGNKFISIFIGYLVAALAVSICFKAKLFNLGISGQMMMGGFMTLLIFKLIAINGGTVVLALVISMLMGALCALLAGFLKTYFGINEVVSTIMINWIIFFLIKFMVQQISGLSSGDSLSSNLSLGYIMPNFFQPSDLNNSWFTNGWNWIIIVLGLALSGLIWVIVSKTAFGYKIHMTGFNRDAADYSGTNQTTLILSIMAISGALSGLAGFIWYVGQGGQIDIGEQPPLAGFDAIAISLLVFNNPLAIVGSSFIYGLINAGSPGLHSQFIGLPNAINEIVIGLMVYIAAVCVIFSKFNVGQWIKKFFILSPHQQYRSARVVYWKARFNYWANWFRANNQIRQIKSANKATWKTIKDEHLAKVDAFVQELWTPYIAQHGEHLNVELLSETDQQLYFETLARLKKERDIALAAASYFEKVNIRSFRVSQFHQDREAYNQVKQTILTNWAALKGAQKTLHTINKGEYTAQEIEALLAGAWAKVATMESQTSFMKEAKIEATKQSIVDFGQQYGIDVHRLPTEQPSNQGGIN